MNAGQLLLALSPLSSGNAGQHLLAIQLGSGAGPAQTIYCSQTYSVLPQEDVVVFWKRQKAAPATQYRPVVRPSAPTGKVWPKDIFVSAPVPIQVTSRREVDEVFAVRTVREVVVERGTASTVVAKAQQSITVTNHPSTLTN